MLLYQEDGRGKDARPQRFGDMPGCDGIIAFLKRTTSSLSDLKNRSENSAGRGQILPVLQVNSRSIDQKSGKICTGQADLQPISFKSDRLLEFHSERLECRHDPTIKR